MKNVKEILEKIYNNPEARRKVVPLFIGKPGLGKTAIVEQFAKEKGVKLVELITSQMSPFEISGICVPVHATGKMSYYNLDRLEELVDGDILIFDELLNGNPIVLNACLTILEQRRFISGKSLPNIMIVAASNREGMCVITPQIKERFVWYDVGFNKDMWITYMKEKYQITTEIGNKLSSLIVNESFTTENFYTPRSIDKAVNMIINNIPTPYKDVISVILNTLVKNPFENSVDLPDGTTLEKEEMISWLRLTQLKNKTYEIITKQ